MKSEQIMKPRPRHGQRRHVPRGVNDRTTSPAGCSMCYSFQVTAAGRIGSRMEEKQYFLSPELAYRLAAIDIGTNSIRLIVAEPLRGGKYRILD